MDARLGFVGAGNMAQALIGGLAQHGGLLHAPVVVDPNPEALDRLGQKHPIEPLLVPGPALTGCDAIVLAVKPDQMRGAVQALLPFLGRSLLISIAAGIPTDAILAWIARPLPLVRCMPNTPALIGAGITGLFATATVSASERSLADALLQAVGETLWVDDEGLLDAVTAVSGSGPAYVFYFIEALERAALEIGLPAGASTRLALATFAGATRLAVASDEPIQGLRERVTSKGGTTYAALSHLMATGVAEHIVDAVRAARDRSFAMGREFGTDTADVPVIDPMTSANPSSSR